MSSISRNHARRCLVCLLLLQGLHQVAWAQSIDEAVQAYNEDRYEAAAVLFSEVATRTDNADDRLKAEYYLGHSLYRAGYMLASYPYYLAVFEQGPTHPLFLRATEGLLDVGEELRDDTFIPSAIDKGYAQEFQNLGEDRVNSINYFVGMLAQRRKDFDEAELFLKEVSPRSSHYMKARYLLGVMSLEVAFGQGAETYDETLRYFTEIVEGLRDRSDEDDKKLYRLALLGEARTYYSQGNYPKSIASYERVPRFSDDWYDAMFESGWAYRQNALEQSDRKGFSKELGKALGMIHSVQSPYFDDRHRAESFVLKATAYFDVCHFDRVRKTLEDFFNIYEPMAEYLKAFLKEEFTYPELVDLIVRGSPGFPKTIRKHIASNRRFQKFLGQMRTARAELGRAEEAFPRGTFKRELLAVLEDQLEARVGLTGYLVREQMSRVSVFLDDFLNQGRIIKFETADAERKILEGGKDLGKGPRPKGARAAVEGPRQQSWGFNGEYWLDELGYYRYSIRNECVDELFPE